MTADGHGGAAGDGVVDGGAVGDRAHTVTPARAARELELGRDELGLGVQLGLVRTVPAGGGGRWRVERRELDRLRAAPDFPAGLRDRVRAVGTGEAAALLGIAPGRFTGLARTGHLSPVRFSLNRYRAVVWTYPAEEVAEFGRRCPALLAGRLPPDLRERLAAHEDLRPRNWRARRLALLLRATGEPWTRASAVASLLDPVQVAEIVDDPYERAHLDRLRPPPPTGLPVSAAAREIAERLMRADDPDEILWHRLNLALALDEARAAYPAPHPGEGVTAPPLPAGGGTGPVSSAWTGAPPAAPPGAGPAARPGAADPWALPVAVRGGPRALSAPPVPPVGPVPQRPPGPLPEFPMAVAPAAPVFPVPDASVRTAPEAPGPEASVPEPSGRPMARPGRPPSRPARTRLLDRFRRGRPGRAARTRRRRRPAEWP
ncbi:DUF6397 family protein [Streptomyces sp. NPDC001744]|uniref:DUF6397 family protein n=1 Tax=Streptomyces sp. NPDC001744 TaxID=3364606 RepID=UPI00368BB3C4